MEFTQVLDTLLIALPLVFCAAFIAELTNSIFCCWDDAGIRVLPTATIQQPKIEPTQQAIIEPATILDPWTDEVQPVSVIKPTVRIESTQTLLLPPARVEKRKPGRPRKNPVAATGGKKRARV